MALNLEELKFVVITDDLDTAAKKIKTLGDELAKVNKPTKQAAIDAEKLALAQANVAKKAAEVEDANNKAALSALKLSKAQDGATESSKTHMSVLEKQQSITSYMSEGLSKGMATIMSYGKAAGLAANDLKLLLDTLQTQKKFSGDPFDKSLSGVTSLKNELGILKEVQRLYGAGVELTSKQVRELASDKERLIVKLKEEGASLSTMKSELRNLKSEYVNLATSINKFSDAESQMIKQQKDAAKATAYLADADARLAAALDVSNSKLDKAGSDALVKYEKALRQSGMGADEAAAKLAKAKTQFDAIADKKQADKLQYLARAISVQMGDVGISLASGMNPLLVMIQQGDQIRGAIQQAGASGKELEKAMGNAAAQIASSFMDTGKAIGGFFVNAIKSSGKAITDFAMTVTGTEQILERWRYSIALQHGSNSKWMDSFKMASSALQIFSGVMLVAAIAGLVALAKGLYDVIKEQDAMTVQLVKTGASLGINTTAAVAYAEALNSVGVNSSTALKVMAEMAKEGGFVAGEINMIVTSANNLKFAGVAIEDTVKQFAKLKDKPVEALTEIAKATGMVAPEILKVVVELSKQGKESEAAAVAMKAYADVTIQQKDRLKTELTGFAIFMKTLSSNVSDFFDETFRALWRKTSPTENLKRQIKEVEETIRLGTQASPTTRAENDAKLAALKEQLKYSQQASDNDQTRLSDQARLSKAFGEYAKDVAQFSSNKDKREKEIAEAQVKYQGLIKAGLITQVEYEKLIQNIRDKYKDEKGPAVTVTASKDLSIIQKDYNEQLRLAEGFAKDERSILKARFDAGLIERADFIAQDTALLTRTEQKQLDVIDSFTGKYRTAYEAQATLLAEAFGKAKDPENKKQLQEQLVNLTKDFVEFNATVEDTKAKLGSAFSAREQVALLEYEKAAFASTKTFKEYAKAQEDAAENKRIDLELTDRLSNSYGAEAAVIKAVADETKRQTAEVSKFTKAQEEAYKQYLLVLSNPNSSWAELEAAGGAYTTAMINANKAIAISKQSITQAGIDAEMQYYMQEYNKLKGGIADAITTALFDGAKAGSKKLRDVIEAELRKPITLFVNAVVNSLMGNSTGSSGGSALSNVGSSLVGKAIGSIGIGGSTLGAMGQYFATGFMNTIAGTGAATGAAAGGAIGGANGIAMQMGAYGPYALAAAAVLNALGAFRTTKQVGGGISGTLGAGDINSYATMRKSGTLFRGPSYWTESRGKFAESDALQASFAQLKDNTATMAEAVGVSSDAVKSFTKDISISFDGLTSAQIQEKIATTFKGVGDELAALVLGAGATAEQLSSLYNNIMQQRYDLETQLLTLQGDTVALRERERVKIYETNQALYDQVKALEAAKPALEEKTKLEQQLAILQGTTTQSAIDRAALLTDENRLIYDQIQVLQEKTKAEEEYKAALESATKSVVDEIARLRGVNTDQAGLEAQFAIVTAQARAGDVSALAKLPAITQGLEQIAGATAINATDIVMARARLAQSLQDTLGYVGANGFLSTAPTATISASGATGATATVSATSSNQELLSALVTEVQGLRAEVRADVSHNAKTAKILERANQDGETLSVSATIDGGVV